MPPRSRTEMGCRAILRFHRRGEAASVLGKSTDRRLSLMQPERNSAETPPRRIGPRYDGRHPHTLGDAPMQTLAVMINGRRAATLAQNLPQSGTLTLTYGPDYAASPDALPLSRLLPLAVLTHTGDVLRNVLLNLLPDDKLVRVGIAKRWRLADEDLFGMLAEAGRDCAGAVRFVPEDDSEQTSDGAGLRLLTEAELEALLLGLADPVARPLGMSVADPDFRILVAGAQRKTALVRTERSPSGWAVPGTTNVAVPTTHILKTPIASGMGNALDLPSSCENEWLCLEVARAFGLPAARAELVRAGEAVAIAVERFDGFEDASTGARTRRHVEDFCQTLGVPPRMKYEADGGPGIARIMEVLEGSLTSEADRRTFMTAQMLMWLLNATDAHAKNYSLMLEPGGYRLAPLYDILSLEPLVDAGAVSAKRLKLAMALVGRNRHYRTADIQPRHFLSTAEAVGFPVAEMKAVMEEMAGRAEAVATEVWGRFPDDFPKGMAEPILTQMIRRAGMMRAQ